MNHSTANVVSITAVNMIPSVLRACSLRTGIRASCAMMNCKSLSIAAKALLPPPAKHEGLADVELRYRQRYVDLWANPEVMKLARLRTRVLDLRCCRPATTYEG